MKRFFCLIAVLLIWLTAVLPPLAWAEEGLTTAQELFEREPSPDVRMSCDPTMDNTLVLVNKEQNSL